MIVNVRYRVKYANPALQEVIGYSAQEMTDNNVVAIVHPDEVEEHQKKLRYLRDTAKSSIFSRHRTQDKDGHWVWLETSGYNMLHDSAIDGLVFSIEDISLRKQAEIKLEEERALLRAVLDLNPSMIYAKDTEGRFTISNLSFQRRYGYASEEELRGKTSYEVFLTMANPLQTIENLSMLKKLGLRLALDDFGTGYSSLAYLQKLPIDVLKIDKAFVHGLGKNPGDTEIVRLILALAQTLNLETVAEGVETTEHVAELKKLGCYMAQGYVFSPPVSAEEAEELVRTARRFSLA